jgi:DNA-binding transcriptional LysR family regulator
MHKENWDDLRYVLAVAETGTVSAAARQLGVNHATVLRRIAAFEERHGAPVFQRSGQGYTLRADRLRMLDAAREVENAVLAVGRLIRGAEAPLRGDVRITSTDTFCHAVLPSIMAEIQAGAPELRLTLLCSNDHLDLSRLHADIAVRPSPELRDGLVGQVAAHLGVAVYAAPGAPDRWLGVAGALTRSRAGEWVKQKMHAGDVAGAADSFIVLREMAAQGLGRSVLPCCLGDPDPRLVRLGDVVPDPSVEIWVASHEDLADVPRIAAVRRMLVDGLAKRAGVLSGAPGAVGAGSG